MTTKQALLAFALIGTNIGVAAEKPEGQITFKVADEKGKPLGGVPVRVDTVDWVKPGEGFGQSIYKQTTIVTDEHGLAQLKTASQNPEFSYRIWDLTGYYRKGGVYAFKSAAGNRWQPWNPTVKLILDRIVNPSPMYAYSVETRIKKPNQKFSFDLKVGDWVAPEGKGQTADVFFEVVGHARSPKDYDSILTVSFTNLLDGIQEFVLQPPQKGSDLRSPRETPVEGYQNNLSFRRARKPDQLSSDWIDETKDGKNYFFRVRTVLDQNGGIKSALYGKIYGGFKFGGAVENGYLEIPNCYLNPDPNSRSMEFDPKRNLFKDSKGKGDISAP